MLEKVEGNTKVDKLRAILLMEEDFNQMNKLLFGHRMIKQSEKEKRIPDEAYGSRASLNANLVAVNRRLVIDLFKQKRRCGAIAGVDAAQCYDRIVHSLAILLCQKEGAPMSSLLMMFGTIQCMTYFIRTTFGDSQGSYGGHKDIPFQGTCQGNGASPAIWLLISIYLILLMKEEGHVSKIRSPMSGIVLTLVGFLFVDDTDLVIMGEKPSMKQKSTLDYKSQSIFGMVFLELAVVLSNRKNATGILHVSCGQMASGGFQRKCLLPLQSKMTTVEPIT